MAKKPTPKNSGKSGAAKGSLSLFARLLTGLAWVSVLLLCLCVGSMYVSPAVVPLFGILGLGFPFFWSAVLFMLLVCLLFVPRRSWIPLVGLLIGSVAAYNYCPINLSSPAPKGCLKVLTWNVQGFGGMKEDDRGKSLAANYIRKCDADVVCFQEGWISKPNLKKIKEQLKDCLPYMDTCQIFENTFGVLSRYPIVGKEILARGYNNGAGVFLLKLKKGDTLRVVNCHLESMKLLPEDRTMWSKMVHDPDDNSMNEEQSKRLYTKITSSSAARAEQADLIGDYVFRHRHLPLLVCGDFNDTPISYTHYRIGRDLTDAYRATSNGIGRTFNRDAIYVRIDHMFCSDHWKPFSCRIDNKVKISDHYPMTCYFKRVKP
ncbi:MAG: endonuclease/exonuclease/phosphatase family protein [Bacteroidaceae bacterium]|nr:endonuclease/exonuclease/phosphatase family protein [Bacteroidaceae bacterium]